MDLHEIWHKGRVRDVINCDNFLVIG